MNVDKAAGEIFHSAERKTSKIVIRKKFCYSKTGKLSPAAVFGPGRPPEWRVRKRRSDGIARDANCVFENVEIGEIRRDGIAILSLELDVALEYMILNFKSLFL